MNPLRTTWALACLYSAVQSLAQPPKVVALADLSLEELLNMEITSVSKRAQPLSDAASSVFVITAEDIRRSSAANLPQALRLAPNLHVAQINNGAYSITARGFGGSSANKQLVMIDGRYVYSPLFAGVFWDVQNLVMQDIERIEVISGPGGTIWGLNAVNGVINIITRSAHDTRGGLVALNTGNQGSDGAFRYGGRLGDNGSWRAYVSRTNLNHTHLASGGDLDDALQMNQTGFRIDWRSEAEEDLTMQGDVYSGTHGQPAPGSIALPGAKFLLEHIDTKGANLSARWTRHLHEGSQVSLAGYWDYTERLIPPFLTDRLDTMTLQGLYTVPSDATHAWVLGATYRRGHDRSGNSEFFAFLPPHVTQEWIALFAQDDMRLSPELRLTLGARIEHNDYTGHEVLPSIRLAWKFKPDQLLWASLSRPVRAPSRLDRDAYVPRPLAMGPGPPYLFAGGPDVSSETVKALQVGYRGQPLPQVNYDFTWFRSLYDHLRTQEWNASRDQVVFANHMRAEVDGIEMWGTYQATPQWRLSAGFTGLHEHFSLKPGSTDLAGLKSMQGRDPAQIWQIRSSWDFPRHRELEFTVRHVSELKTPKVPGYVALDARYEWRPNTRWAVSIGGRNIGGTAHGEFSSIETRTQVRPSVYVQAISRF